MCVKSTMPTLCHQICALTEESDWRKKTAQERETTWYKIQGLKKIISAQADSVNFQLDAARYDTSDKAKQFLYEVSHIDTNIPPCGNILRPQRNDSHLSVPNPILDLRCWAKTMLLQIEMLESTALDEDPLLSKALHPYVPRKKA